MRKWALVVAGAAVALPLAMAFAPTPGVAALKDQPVTVTNTDQNPVPITGTVGVTNLPAIQAVSGTVAATQSGPWSVGVVDTREPFEARAQTSLSVNDFNGAVSFAVPSGKRLVVEYISVSAYLPDNQTPQVLVLGGGGIPLNRQGVTATSAGTSVLYVGALSMRDYEPGASFSIGFDRSRSDFYNGTVAGEATLVAYVSGYLVPA